MNRKYVNTISLINGFLGMLLGFIIAYQAISTDRLWIDLWGGLGFGLLGLDSLLDKKINTIAKSLILIAGMLCLVVYLIGLLS